MNASLILRVQVRSCERYRILTYCWVIVDAPWVAPFDVRLLQAARKMPLGSRPGSVQNVRFSADTTALRMEIGICANGMLCRFWTANVPRTWVPSE